MNPYDYYITPEEYEQAAANGINRHTLSRRIREYGWDKARAMTELVKVRQDRRQLLQIAKENGVGRVTFQTRISRGWGAERAATTPPSTAEDNAERLREIAESRRKYPKEFLELAKANGIARDTFGCRMRSGGWSLEQAATVPPMTKEALGRQHVRRYKELCGMVTR